MINNQCANVCLCKSVKVCESGEQRKRRRHLYTVGKRAKILRGSATTAAAKTKRRRRRRRTRRQQELGGLGTRV